MTFHSAMLRPPYERLGAVDGNAPLGTILVVSLGGNSAGLALALDEHRLMPWCPVVVLIPADDPIDARALQLLLRAGATTAGALGASASELTPAAVIAAADARPAPNAGDLARQAAKRIGRPGVEPLLCACFARAWNDPTPSQLFTGSDDTIQRRLREVGPLRPRDWTIIARLVRFVHAARADTGSSRLRIAADCRIDYRTIRTRTRGLLGRSVEAAVSLAGWEWLVEAALRRSGYVRLADTRCGT